MKYNKRKRKGALLILELVMIMPFFLFVIVLIFEGMMLYSVLINNSQATQAAMSEIAFMSSVGTEGKIVKNAVNKANGILSYGTGTGSVDSTRHQYYTYRLYDVSPRPGYTKDKMYVLNHTNPSSSMFTNSKGQFEDHLHEIWAFETEVDWTFNSFSYFGNSVNMNLKYKYHMGILRGVDQFF